MFEGWLPVENSRIASKHISANLHEKTDGGYPEQ